MGKARRTGRHGARHGSCDPRPGAASFAGEQGDDEAAARWVDVEVRGVLLRLLGEAYDALDEPDEYQLDSVTASVAAMCAASTTRRVVVLTLLDSMASATSRAWQLGWQPADVHRLVGRRLGVPEQAIALDAMRHELEQYAPSTVDRRWLAQLRELADGPTAPAPSSTSWIDARRDTGTDWFTLVSQVLPVMHLLTRLPQLERLTPLPGEARAAAPGAAGRSDDTPPADERILSRVRMLLAKAESTTFEAEAATFTAGAQALMTRHSIDAALLDRGADHPAHGQALGRRIGIDNPYESQKASLLQAVASANRCRTVWARELGFATVVGFETDLDSVELLFTSLLVQATRTLAAAGPRRDLHGGSRTRSFRQSFLSAFAHRIGERLQEATAQAEAEAEAGHSNGRELVPLLTARAEQVDEAMASWFPHVRRSRVSLPRDAEGWHSGRSAADRAQLGASPRLEG
ncbi:DUF2786 domain-containing protein [Terrabacter lapilli]|uniref:DUF2786 domain-containing protein n=1 Tax=Terrabacter lapilli TaxID=436231 RepID=A0ABN2S613_9MICO